MENLYEKNQQKIQEMEGERTYSEFLGEDRTIHGNTLSVRRKDTGEIETFIGYSSPGAPAYGSGEIFNNCDQCSFCVGVDTTCLFLSSSKTPYDSHTKSDRLAVGEDTVTWAILCNTEYKYFKPKI